MDLSTNTLKEGWVEAESGESHLDLHQLEGLVALLQAVRGGMLR